MEFEMVTEVADLKGIHQPVSYLTIWTQRRGIDMKKKGFLLASSVGVALIPVAGQAADMAPVYKSPPPPPAPITNWAGFYIGVSGGGMWQSATTNAYEDWSLTKHKSTGIVGGQLGYNWQAGTAVYGIEADGSWTGGNKADDGCHGYCGGGNSIRWLSTVRARTGLAVGNTMAYVTGGVAFGGVSNQFRGKSESKTRVGWTIGGGVETMFTRNWTFAIEGLFVDLGKKSVDPFGSSKPTTFSNQAVIGRAKLNYKF
jgi:outer membrane immunogenic protein